MPNSTIVQDHTTNFETLIEAFENEHVVLVECTLKSTGEKVATICTFYWDDEGLCNFTPFATFLNGNPFDLLEPPK